MSKIGIFDIDHLYLLGDEKSIKSDILLFDKIYFIYNESRLNSIAIPSELNNRIRNRMAEIEELEKHGLITYVPDPFQINKFLSESNIGSLASLGIDVQRNQQLKINFTEQDNIIISSARKQDDQFYNDTMNDMNLDLSTKNNFLKYWNKDRFVRQFVVRILSSHFRKSDPDTDYIPIIRGQLNELYVNENDKKAQVIKVISNKMPFVDESISIQALKDFKNNEDSRRKYFALRNFINDLSRKEFSQAEMNERIEELLNDYEEDLKKHRIKYNLNAIETIVITTGYILENLIKLKFGELAKMFFTYKKEGIKLLEEELNLEGKEIAYINKANEYFT
jgi:hypothetical protein